MEQPWGHDLQVGEQQEDTQILACVDERPWVSDMSAASPSFQFQGDNILRNSVWISGNLCTHFEGGGHQAAAWDKRRRIKLCGETDLGMGPAQST